MEHTKMKCGIIFRFGSCWVGAHYSKYNKRLCVNILPFITFWFVGPKGITPKTDGTLFAEMLERKITEKGQHEND